MLCVNRVNWLQSTEIVFSLVCLILSYTSFFKLFHGSTPMQVMYNANSIFYKLNRGLYLVYWCIYEKQCSFVLKIIVIWRIQNCSFRKFFFTWYIIYFTYLSAKLFNSNQYNLFSSIYSNFCKSSRRNWNYIVIQAFTMFCIYLISTYC